MAKTNLYLDLRGKAKDGKGSVLITISHNHTTATIPTGIRLLPKEWDGKKVVKCPNADALNIILNSKKGEVDRKLIILSMRNDFDILSATKLKEEIVFESYERIPKTQVLVKDLFNEYMQTTMSDGTRSSYIYTLKKIESFAGSDLKIDDITHKWLLDFEKFMAETMSANGRSVYLRNLRTICNYANRVEATDKYPFKKFSIKQEATQKRSIPIDKLRELYHFKCREAHEKYRDYFFLMFFLVGMNAKDLFLAKKESVSNGRLHYVREKTGTKYSIKIEPEAQALLDKYQGDTYLVDVMERPISSYKWFLDNMDRDLGKIGPEIIEEHQEELFGAIKTKRIVKPIVPGLTSYFARHSWATIAYEIGIPVDVISQALGHRMGNKITLIYIKPDQHKIDDANRRVIDFLLK